MANPKLLCPHCECDDIGWTRRRWYDYLWKFLGRDPLRCRSCSSRFYAKTSMIETRVA